MSVAAMIGWSRGSAILIAQPIAAAPVADVHSLATYEAGSPVWPIRAFSVDRSSSISTHPATPADAVNPAAPHVVARPSARGSGIAHRYPSTVVSTTRTIA